MASPRIPSSVTFFALLNAYNARESGLLDEMSSARAADAALQTLARARDRGYRIVADLEGDRARALLLEALLWAARVCPDRALEIGLIMGATTAQ